MQSKSVLLIGILFVLLLTTFCITNYLNKHNPNIKTIKTLKPEILDKNFLKEEVFQDSKADEEDGDNYLQIIKLVEEEENEIVDIYNKALMQEKMDKKVTAKKPQTPKKIIKQEKIKKPQKLTIETILNSQSISIDKTHTLTNQQKKRLKSISKTLNQNKLAIIRIEASQNSKMLYLIKRYLVKLGVELKDIQVIQNKNSILPDKTIEILVIKEN